jgi:hypothetical protein
MEIEDELFIPPPACLDGKCKHFVDAIITYVGHIYSDITEEIKYVLIVYNYDSISVLSREVKDESDSKAVGAYTHMHQYLVPRGLKPQF